ncbi:leucine-rich repeat isoform f-related [Anaeramoeba flamelloides]|uniref:Leucine-rich repeat isoform f-related n=1 Tax=Anaeramoeba flamelloides TaxID=1746091 RepID=A0AAV7Z002_9EUKA|nr:leucine-rich repeat isoform f-related [Anaeramoeba flamelloides]
MSQIQKITSTHQQWVLRNINNFELINDCITLVYPILPKKETRSKNPIILVLTFSRLFIINTKKKNLEIKSSHNLYTLKEIASVSDFQFELTFEDITIKGWSQNTFVLLQSLILHVHNITSNFSAKKLPQINMLGERYKQLTNELPKLNPGTGFLNIYTAYFDKFYANEEISRNLQRSNENFKGMARSAIDQNNPELDFDVLEFKTEENYLQIMKVIICALKYNTWFESIKFTKSKPFVEDFLEQFSSSIETYLPYVSVNISGLEISKGFGKLSETHIKMAKKMKQELEEIQDEKNVLLNTLDFSNNIISENEMKRFVEIFPYLADDGLEVLKLKSCGLQQSSIKILFNALIEHFDTTCCLWDFDMSQNEFGEEGTTYLIEWLNSLKNTPQEITGDICRQLMLSNTNIALPPLLKTLGSDFTRISVLDISDNPFTTETAGLLCNLIKETNSIFDLNISRTKFPIEQLTNLFKSIKSNIYYQEARIRKLELLKNQREKNNNKKEKEGTGNELGKEMIKEKEKEKEIDKENEENERVNEYDEEKKEKEGNEKGNERVSVNGEEEIEIEKEKKEKNDQEENDDYEDEEYQDEDYEDDEMDYLLILRASENNFGLPGATVIANELRDCYEIGGLELNKNAFGGEGVSLIVNQLIDKPISTLSLSENVHKANNGFGVGDTLTKLIQNTLTLSSLYVSGKGNMYIGAGLTKLLKKLKKNKTLRWLDVSGNRFGDGGVYHLSTSLKENKTLTELKWDRTNMTLHGLTDFYKNISNNQSLYQVEFPHDDCKRIESLIIETEIENQFVGLKNKLSDILLLKKNNIEQKIKELVTEEAKQQINSIEKQEKVMDEDEDDNDGANKNKK